MSNFTQKAIRETFIELLNEKPLSQITVKMIVEKCGINRNSFYYHYQDIPALIEEMVMEEAGRIIEEYPAIDSIETAMKATIDFAGKNRRAILHIYNSVNRDIFEQSLWKVCEYVVKNYTDVILNGRSIDELDREVIERFLRCECFGIVIEWLNTSTDADVHKQIERFCKLYHGMPEEVLRRVIGES
ncbi:MAG: TetR/AcrR family transcriptional regulator [Lachnospiraceae bacterium]|nr:TetR/AcrR family transcriptional regulator [Lachnospiraceae bacterium]